MNYRLWIAGEGPLFKEIKKRAPASAEFLGWLSHEEILERLNRAAFFIFPSELYEGFPLSLLEAMAMGKAIIASDLGPSKGNDYGRYFRASVRGRQFKGFTLQD